MGEKGKGMQPVGEGEERPMTGTGVVIGPTREHGSGGSETPQPEQPIEEGEKGLGASGGSSPA